MAMSTLTAEAIPPAIETVLLRQDVSGANIALCMLLGVERSNAALFEGHLAVLLRQVQVAAFAAPVSLPEFLFILLSPLRLSCPPPVFSELVRWNVRYDAQHGTLPRGPFLSSEE